MTVNGATPASDGRQPGLDLDADGRMDDGLEVLERGRVVEDDRRQGRAIELAAIVEDGVTESRPDRRQGRPARTGHDACQGIGVDDQSTPGREVCGDGRLAAADGTGEPDDDAHRGARSSVSSQASSAWLRAASTSASSLETRRSST